MTHDSDSHSDSDSQSILSPECLGKGNTKKKGKLSGSSKLVDLVAIRSKFSLKLSSVVKFATTALNEALGKYKTFVQSEESAFYERFQGELYANTSDHQAQVLLLLYHLSAVRQSVCTHVSFLGPHDLMSNVMTLVHPPCWNLVALPRCKPRPTSGVCKSNSYDGDRAKILLDESAGDEAGMMKCMFHVDDRCAICQVLVATDREDLRSRMMAALQLTALGDNDTEAGSMERYCPELHSSTAFHGTHVRHH